MSAADIDLRAFDYPLGPLQERERWALEKVQARAARVLAGALALQEQLHGMERDCEAQRRHLLDNVQRYLDPAMHRRAMEYLLHTQANLATVQKRIDAAQAEHRELLALCMRQQLRIDVLESHRRQQLDQYAMAQRTRQAAEQDHGWIARSLWLEAVAQGE